MLLVQAEGKLLLYKWNFFFVAMVSYKVKLHHQWLYEKAIFLFCLLALYYDVVEQTEGLEILAELNECHPCRQRSIMIENNLA